MTRKRMMFVAMALFAFIGTAIAAPPVTNYANVGNWVYGVYSSTVGTLKVYKTSAIAVTIDGSAATANRTITLPDGAVTLTTGTMVATSGATFTGTVKLNDSVNLVLGTGNDLTVVHDGTNTSATSAVGDLIVDNTDVDDQIILRVGTDTTATGFEFRNNSDSPILNVKGDGSVSETAMASFDLSPSGIASLRGGGVSTFGDDTGYLSFDGLGAVTETGITNFGLSPTGTLTLQGGGASKYGDDVATLDFDGAGAVGETAMTSFAITPSGAITFTAGAASTWSSSAGGLSLTSADSATWQLSGSAGGNLTLAIDSVNAGAGEGRLTVSADEQIDINDGTLNLTLDGGSISETGLVNADLTGTGTMTVAGGGVSNYGDDVAKVRFDGAGAVSLTGVTTLEVDASGLVTIESSGGGLSMGADPIAQAVNIATGAAARVVTIGNAATGSIAIDSGVGALSLTSDVSSTWQISGNAVGNQTLALDAVNAGAGEGRLTLSADEQINLNDGTGDLQFDSGVVTETGMVSVDFTPSGAVTLRGGGASQFGDDTGYVAFDGAGAASTSGVTTLDVDSSGAIQINSSGAAVSVANDNVAQGLNLGTAGARPILIGSAAAASVGIDAGVGAASLTSDTTITLTAGSSIANVGRVTTTDGVAAGTARVVGGRAYSAVAASTAITGATETEANFDSSYSIPADTLKAGTVLSYDFQGIHTATTGTETHDILVKLGSTTIASKATIDPANSDIFSGRCSVTIRTAGVGGTMVGTCQMSFGASGTAAPVEYYLPETAVDTTGALVAAIAIDRQGAATDGDSARLDIMNVRIE